MENKKMKIISIASLFALIITVIGATYAYFQAQTGTGAATDIEISANTVDTFSFEVGDPLKFTVDQFTFTEGGNNASASTFAKAILTANSKTNTVTEHYYLYLNININTFTYSQDSTKPELLLQITDKSGNAVTNVTGLEYKTVTNGAGTQISGFDVTTKNGLITLFDNREITTTSTLEEQWNVTLIFVNYEFNQAANGGNVFNAKILIQKAAVFTNLTDVCKDGENLASCIKTLSEESVSGATHIYYHSSNLPLSAADNSYRYAGSSESVNNFVCFGSTAIPCPMDNLYRIIGVIDGQVKLIKHNYASSTLLGTDGDYYRDIRYYWNYVATKDSSNGYGLNSWDTSLLNKTNLNTNFINNIGTEWANKISNSTWKVSGYNFLGLTAKEMYNVEIENATKTFVDSNGMSKIGLMYASDYGFAASSNAWVLKMSDYDDCSANNWMSLGNVELTISPYTSRVSYIYYISAKGYLNSGGITFSAGYVRPSFYLNSTVTYKSGSGTQSDPIIIN